MDRKGILQEIRSLKNKVDRLSKEIEKVKSQTLDDPSHVERLLRLRGYEIFRENPTEKLFFPPDLSPRHKAQFYEMMKKYSFRLVVRDIIKSHDRFQIEDLTHYCSSKAVQSYIQMLHKMGVIVENGKDGFRTLVTPLYSFGPTLEWFIAEMFKKEFSSPALYGVSIKKTRSGGDFDVIASWNRRLLYVEVKSSPPRGVELSEVTTFLSRIDDLLPDLAILFNDTQLRMKDKLVVLFEEELAKRYGREARSLYPVERLVEELFHIRDRIFIINSRKDVVQNFSVCLRHYLRHGEARR